MHYSKWEWQNIALAAVAQSAALVDELATRGKADTLPVAACINPLLKFNPSSAAEVYPNITQLSMGLRTMQDVFSGISQEQNSEVIRYLLGMLALRQKLMGDPDMQNQVQEGLQKVIPVSLVGPEEATDGEPELVDRETEEYYKQLAGVYQDTISTYTFRIRSWN